MEREQQQRRAEPAAPQRTATTGPAVAHALLRLQRTAGNAATLAALGRSGGTIEGETESLVRRVVAGPGRPFEEAELGRLEQPFGADLSQVRLHEGTAAVQAASAIDARAFSVGHDVVLGREAPRTGEADRDHVVAHEVAHTLQHRADDEVHRIYLPPEKVISAVTKIPFVDKKLQESLALPNATGLGSRNPLEGTLREHVDEVMAQYKAELAAADSGLMQQVMALSVVVDAVAQAIAVNVLNDPALAGRLAYEFLTIYGPEIRGHLDGEDLGASDVDKTMELAAILTNDDPIRLYLHGELETNAAARRIKGMARAAGNTPKEMFDVLRHRFDIDMASRSKAQIQKSEDKGVNGAYSVRNATGEMTMKYFEDLFGTAGDVATWKTGTSGRQLDYTVGAQTKLDDLETAVLAATASATPTTRPGNLTFKQEEHLDDVDAADNAKKTAIVGGLTLDQQVSAVISTLTGMPTTDADKVVAKLKAELPNLPLTVTVSGERWFASMTKPKSRKSKDKGDFDYGAGSGRRNEAKLPDLFEKKGPKGHDGSIKHYGEWEQGPNDGQNRGRNYNRFRGWKDQTMTGNRGLTDAELPAFAALNPTWDTGAKGTEMSVRDADETMQADAGVLGVNSYGDVHFLLDPAKVGGRSVFTASDHGEPHADPYLAFVDFLLGGGSRTGLKDTKNDKMAMHVLNAVVLGGNALKVSIGNLGFECQIFGKLNMVDDVTELFYASTVPKNVRKNIEKYGQRFGRTVTPIADDPGITVMSERLTFGNKKAQFFALLNNEAANLP